jgi:transcriptional regulator with XRE-family HTH domain
VHSAVACARESIEAGLGALGEHRRWSCETPARGKLRVLSHACANIEGGTMTLTAKADPLNLAVGKRIRALREEQGISQRDLARRGGFACSYVQRAERGLVTLRAKSIFQFAHALGVESVDVVNTDVATNARARFVDRSRRLSATQVRAAIRSCEADIARGGKTSHGSARPARRRSRASAGKRMMS